jgi:hypothetical protein
LFVCASFVELGFIAAAASACDFSKSARARAGCVCCVCKQVQEQEQEIGFGEQQTDELVEHGSCGIFVMRSLRIEDHGTRCRNGRRI